MAPFSSRALSGLLLLLNRAVIQLFSYLRGCTRVNGWNGKDGDLKGYKKRGEVSFSHRVMKHFITAFFWLCSSSDIINFALCDRKTLWKNSNTAVFKQMPQTLIHPQAFCSQIIFVCKSGINSLLMRGKAPVQSGGLLLFTLCSSF